MAERSKRTEKAPTEAERKAIERSRKPEPPKTLTEAAEGQPEIAGTARKPVEQAPTPETAREPEPVRKPMEESLWDKAGVAAYVEGFWANPNETGLRQAVADWLGKGDGGTLLDVGCGSARIAPMLRGYEYWGVDGSEELLALARERVSPQGAVKTHDLAEPLPFEDDEFDVVISMNVLRHMDSYEAVVAEMARVAKRSVYIVDLFQSGTDDTYGKTEVAGQVFANNAWSLSRFLASAARLGRVETRDLAGMPWPVTGVKIETS